MSVYKIALLAGVSVATVSRVLNGSTGVKQAKRDSVMNAVKELNYQPNLIARQLRTARNNLIQVLVPNISDPFCAEVVLGIEFEAEKYGYRILLNNCHCQSFNERYDSLVGSMNVIDGIISMDSVLSEMELEKVIDSRPWVQCIAGTSKASSSVVSVDDFSAAEFMVNYLYKIGRKNIAMITLPKNYKFATAREKAYHLVLSKLGLESHFVIAKELSFNAGALAAKELFESNKTVDAVFTVSDLIAIGAIKEANSQDIEIPKDVSISGFDGLHISEFLHPKLTTIKIDAHALGCEAFKLLLLKMNSDKNPNIESVIKWEFALGQSTEIE